MKRFKKMLMMGLAAAMAMSAMNVCAMAEATVSEEYAIDDNAIEILKEVGKEKIQNFFIESDEEIYDIVGFEFTDDDVKVEQDKVSFDTLVTVKEKLKAESVNDMPYIKGYMSAFGIDSYLDASENAKEAAAKSVMGINNDVLTETQSEIIDEVVSAIDGAAASFGEYIGETSNFNYEINVAVSIDNIETITSENITLTVINDLEGETDISIYRLRSAEDIYSDGRNDALNKIEEISVQPAWTSTKIDNWSNYDRIAARDYAYKYYKNYNPSYTSYKTTDGSGGDCANFVSQCIYAGGVPTDSTWKKDSTTWIRVKELRPYMVNTGYATKTTYTNTTAGNFATKTDESHVVLITINDGSKVAYTGHTTDEKDTVIGTYGNYNYYVIKNY